MVVFEELRRVKLVFTNISVIDISQLVDGSERVETRADSIAYDDYIAF